ncbi:arsenate reductase/protein-tyrosine-phosphatase family protein [Corynebacterium variabile]|uniref:Protein-tyrosine phosphatase n=1 Tax=Corynebacterium variabile (strain DSM 44702 / CIP 107183 / JCM 12073 / NCIMB 30131) TaxID=858619 RepID=G0HCT8_CORVD|nr:protein-tyrosine-phosphatase [Corynebacterium variabile]AEK35663.1 protein-tyrosine phosphatase [Corynebacterium variabile DSM 44702]
MTPSLPILFVCTGNICRSPVAEYLLRDALRGVAPDLAVASAGVAGLTDSPMDPRSLAWLQDHGGHGADGIDGSGFTARRVNRRILKDASLVIGFEQRHVDSCLALFPGAISRTFRLSQLAAWQRSGELTTLVGLRDRIHELTPVATEHEDPVAFSSAEAYTRVLDGIADDVRAVAALVTAGR